MNKIYLPVPGDPVQALISYLHDKMQLSKSFDKDIHPMLASMHTDKKYHCEKTKGVMRTAFWINEGYGFVTVMVENKQGIPMRRIVNIFGPGKIMLHSDGFFNNVQTICEFWIARGSVVVPFTTQNFADLSQDHPEANALANCILSENDSLSLIKSCMLKLPAGALLEEMNRIFGKAIWQHFSQRQLSDYTGITQSYMTKMKKRWIKQRADF